jgi:hypothetical protein
MNSIQLAISITGQGNSTETLRHLMSIKRRLVYRGSGEAAKTAGTLVVTKDYLGFVLS